MKPIDLRSDTVTVPTPAMREAMARAAVGDDVFGEDPTVNELEELSARYMGKEAALFLPSGTMGNLVAVMAHCGRGDEVILGDQSHTFLSEAGGVAALGGVHPRPIPNGRDGTLSLAELESAIRPDDPHYPISRLICLENTHNLCGGVALAAAYVDRVGALARRFGLALHIDGARIFHASIALGEPAASLAEAADTVTFCISKGLCAPVGSILCGTRDFVAHARRIRKQLGGGMRQAGVIAAAGIVALNTMVDRLAEDHRRAVTLADLIGELPGVALDWNPPPTNMVYFHLAPDSGLDAEELTNRMQARGVRVLVEGPRRVRMVLHYWIGDEDVVQAADALAQSLAPAPG
ncbi:MAG: low-specificity L-threonine aldolase [Anaerolineales bacterium]